MQFNYKTLIFQNCIYQGLTDHKNQLQGRGTILMNNGAALYANFRNNKLHGKCYISLQNGISIYTFFRENVADKLGIVQIGKNEFVMVGFKNGRVAEDVVKVDLLRNRFSIFSKTLKFKFSKKIVDRSKIVNFVNFYKQKMFVEKFSIV